MFNPPPIRFRPGAKALIVRDHKILVVKENFPREGKPSVLYDFPGGGIELGETVEEGLHREVFEEIGLKVTVIKPVGTWDFIAEKKIDNTGLVHIICCGFQCQILGDDTIDTSHNPADEDIFETLWLTKAEIEAIPTHQWSTDIRSVLTNVTF